MKSEYGLYSSNYSSQGSSTRISCNSGLNKKTTKERWQTSTLLQRQNSATHLHPSNRREEAAIKPCSSVTYNLKVLQRAMYTYIFIYLSSHRMQQDITSTLKAFMKLTRNRTGWYTILNSSIRKESKGGLNEVNE